MSADLAILNAAIRTMDPASPTAEALAIANGKITAVGTSGFIRKLCDAETRVIDAQAATVLPGFVESHMHLFLGAFSQKVLQLADVTGTEQITSAIRDFTESNPDEPLLIVQGVAYGCLDDGADPTRYDLDAICTDRPLLLQSADFHNAWVNTAALEAADVLHGRDVGPGSAIVLDSDGVATGLLTEPPAVATVLTLGRHGGREGLGLKGAEPEGPVNAADRAADLALLCEGLAYCAAQGITTIINMDGNLYQADLLKEIEDAGDLICRVELPYHFTPGKPLENVEIAEKKRRDLTSDKLWCGRIKLFMDGVLDMETAYRVQDYPGKPGYKGEPLHKPERFVELATEFDRRGFQISVHAIGDGAVRTVLDGYEAARNANGARDSRHRVEHIELIDPSDLPRLTELGVVASVMPPHPPGCEFPLEPTATIIGVDDWPNAYLWRGLQQAGAPICFSSDWPIASLAPLTGITYVMNRTPFGDGLGDERLSFEDTLAAYTSGGAYAVLKDDQLGRIAAGYRADIVMFDRELTATNTEQTQVVLTICDGTITHEISA